MNIIRNYGLIALALCWPLVLYVAMWVYYGSFSPSGWSKPDIFFYIYFVIGISPLLLFAQICKRKNIDVESFLQFQFNFTELNNKTVSEIVLYHYTNVASIGLLMAIFIYSIKPYVNIWSLGTISLLVSMATLLLFSVYGILFSKTAIAIRQKNMHLVTSMVVVFVLLFIDFKAIQLFIESVPKN